MAVIVSAEGGKGEDNMRHWYQSVYHTLSGDHTGLTELVTLAV